MKYVKEFNEKLYESDELRKAVVLAKEENVVELPIFNSKEEYIGILDLRPVLSIPGIPLKAKVENFIVKYPKLYFENEEQTINDAINYMVSQNIRGVPVFLGINFKGMIYDFNILNYLKDIKFGKNIRVDHISSKNVITVNENDSLAKALAVMRKNHIGRVLITENGKILGILTRTKVLHILSSMEKERPERGEFVGEKYSVFKYPVKEFMDSPVISISNKSSVYNAITQMLENNIRGLPIVNEKGKLIGIITTTDIIRSYFFTVERKLYEKEFTYELHIDDDDIRRFAQELLEKKRFPDKTFIQIFCTRTGKNLYSIRAKVILDSIHLVYSDTARGRIEAFRRIKKMITTLHREIYEEIHY